MTRIIHYPAVSFDDGFIPWLLVLEGVADQVLNKPAHPCRIGIQAG